MADLNAQTTHARMMQASDSRGSGRPTRSREPAGKPAAQSPVPVAQVAVRALGGGPSAYRLQHGTSDEQVIAEVRDYATVHEWVMDLTNQQILDAIGWAHLPGSAVKRIQLLIAAAPARAAALPQDEADRVDREAVVKAG